MRNVKFLWSLIILLLLINIALIGFIYLNPLLTVVLNSKIKNVDQAIVDNHSQEMLMSEFYQNCASIIRTSNCDNEKQPRRIFRCVWDYLKMRNVQVPDQCQQTIRLIR